jgi:hypothetical protein
MLQPDAGRLSALPPIVSGPLFAVLFWWIALALGSRLLRLARVSLPELTLAERGLVTLAIGAGSVQYLPFALSQAGHLTPAWVRGALGLLVLLLAFDLVRVARAVVGAVAGLRLRRLNRDQLLWGGLLLVMLVMFLVQAVTFGEFGDDDGIHLAGPKRWLQAGALIYLPTYTHTTATLGFDMLYLVALATWNAVGAKALHYSAGLFMLFGVVLCGRRISGNLAGVIAVSLLMIACPFWDVPVLMRSAMIDMAACWMTVTAMLLWLAWREKQPRALLVCMALCAGMAASFKLTSLQVAMALSPLLVLEARSLGREWKAILAMLVLFGLVALAPTLPWLYRHWRLTGNPLYPMFSSFFPTRDWPAEHAAVFSRYLKYNSWGINAGPKLGLAARQGLVAVTAIAVALAGTLAWRKVSDTILRRLIIFATVFTVVSVALTGLIFRYWLPALACASLVPGVLYARRWSWASWHLRPACVLLLVALAIQMRTGFFHHKAGLAADLRMATGRSNLEREYPDSDMVHTWAFLNSQTPPRTHVLLAAFYQTVGSSSYAGFWVDDRMCYTTDPHLQATVRLDTWPAFLRSIDDLQIEYVVISDKLSCAGRQGFSFLAVENEYPFCSRLVQEYGERIFKWGHMEVHRLRRSWASPRPVVTPS